MNKIQMVNQGTCVQISEISPLEYFNKIVFLGYFLQEIKRPDRDVIVVLQVRF